MEYFISDLHFGSKGMAVRRGFNTADEMDKYIILKYNKTIHKEDIVYIIGDVGKLEKVKLLNGTKILIKGNHDGFTNSQALRAGFSKVEKMLCLGDRIILTHIPIIIQYDIINVHGHIHNAYIEKENYINVSAEFINYKPLSRKAIDRKIGQIQKSSRKFMQEPIALYFRRGNEQLEVYPEMLPNIYNEDIRKLTQAYSTDINVIEELKKIIKQKNG